MTLLRQIPVRRILSFAALVTGLVSSTSSLAHHPLGGSTPGTFAEGLLSGAGHPVIGFDHLMFIIAAAILAWTLGRGVQLTTGFIAASLVAVFVTSTGVVLPATEFAVLLSLAAAGVALVLTFKASNIAVLAAYIVAGLAHGGAYGAAVVGAESTPIIAYLLGLAVIQGVIVAGAMALVAFAARRSVQPALMPRIAGGVAVGVALTYAVEIAESMLFAIPAA